MTKTLKPAELYTHTHTHTHTHTTKALLSLFLVILFCALPGKSDASELSDSCDIVGYGACDPQKIAEINSKGCISCKDFFNKAESDREWGTTEPIPAEFAFCPDSAYGGAENKRACYADGVRGVKDCRAFNIGDAESHFKANRNGLYAQCAPYETFKCAKGEYYEYREETISYELKSFNGTETISYKIGIDECKFPDGIPREDEEVYGLCEQENGCDYPVFTKPGVTGGIRKKSESEYADLLGRLDTGRLDTGTQDGATESSITCSAGYFLPKASTQCVPCDDRHLKLLKFTKAEVESKYCPSGTYTKDNSKYQGLKDCQKGQIANTNHSACITPSVCSAGQFYDKGKCVSCNTNASLANYANENRMYCPGDVDKSKDINDQLKKCQPGAWPSATFAECECRYGLSEQNGKCVGTLSPDDMYYGPLGRNAPLFKQCWTKTSEKAYKKCMGFDD